jgi:hypothetical protein
MWSTSCVCIVSSTGVQTGPHSLPSVSHLIVFVVLCLEKLQDGSLGTGCLTYTKITLNENTSWSFKSCIHLNLKFYFHPTLFVTLYIRIHLLVTVKAILKQMFVINYTKHLMFIMLVAYHP